MLCVCIGEDSATGRRRALCSHNGKCWLTLSSESCVNMCIVPCVCVCVQEERNIVGEDYSRLVQPHHSKVHSTTTFCEYVHITYFPGYEKTVTLCQVSLCSYSYLAKQKAYGKNVSLASLLQQVQPDCFSEPASSTGEIYQQLSSWKVREVIRQYIT